MRLFVVMSFALAAGVQMALAASDTALQGADLIAQAKQAMGGSAWDRIQVWHETGRLLDSQPPEKYDQQSNIRTLQFHNTFFEGGSAKLSVFDGKKLWIQDRGKTEQSNFDPISGSYQVCFGFFFPGRFPATMLYTGKKSYEHANYDVVKVEPSGMVSFEVWLDQRSHFVARLDTNGGQNPGEGPTEFSDYRNIDGVIVPFTQKHGETTITADKIEFIAEDPKLFQQPR